MKTLYVYFAFLVATHFAIAQNYDNVHIMQLSDSLRQVDVARNEMLANWSQQEGLPLRFNDDNDRGYTMLRIGDGVPVLQTTVNDGAALMTLTKPLLDGGSTSLNLSGNGLSIGQWEAGQNAVRSTHEALTGRVDNSNNTMSVGNHGTQVAGMLMANGLINSDSRGMAPSASTSVYASDDRASIADFAAEGGLVSNHSYVEVVGWVQGSFDTTLPSNSWYWFGDLSITTFTDGPQRFGQYSDQAKLYDEIMYAAPYHTIVRASGNSRGVEGPSQGVFYAWDGSQWTDFLIDTIGPLPHGGADGFDCIPLAGVAKNIITVGGIQKVVGGISGPADVTDYTLSSWGPTDDGRVKPDLVGTATSITTPNASSDDAYSTGRSGTSFSTPNVSGSLLLLQEYHHRLYKTYMRSSTLKALAIHTAQPTDLNPGPNYKHGWGLVDAKKSAEAIAHNDTVLIIERKLHQGEEFTIRFKSSDKPIKATLCWTDPASSNTGDLLNDRTPRLVNDLDVRLYQDPDGTNSEHFPWKLDVENPQNPATRDDNLVDNVEVIDYQPTGPGVYEVVVRHKGNLQDGEQVFSLIVNGRPFEWTGNTDEDWETSTNWVDDVPTSTMWVNIPGGRTHYPSIDGVLDTVGSLSIQPGASLTVKSKLMVNGDVANQGDCTVDEGQMKWNGSYRGALVQQQSTAIGGGWSGVGSSVAGNATLFGDVRVARMNAFYWNGLSADWSVLSESDSLKAGLGYLLYYGTNGVAPAGATLSVEGQPNENVALEIGYGTGNSANFLGDASGWNFLSNPLACALDFSTLDLTEIGNSFSIWNPATSTYEAYAPGGITDPYIAPLQGFWVKANNAQAKITSLSMRENGFLESVDFYCDQTFDRLVLSIQDLTDSLKSDYTVVALVQGTSLGYDANWDALKLPNGADIPSIYSKHNAHLAVNAIPHQPSTIGKTTLPIGVKGGVHGAAYRIQFNDAFMVNAYNIFLEDCHEGRFYDLNTNHLTFVYDSVVPDRFILHIGGFGMDLGADTQTLKPGELWVYEGYLYINTNQPSPYRILDAQGRIIVQAHHQGGAKRYAIPNVSAGTYIVVLDTPKGPLHKKFLHRRH